MQRKTIAAMSAAGAIAVAAILNGSNQAPQTARAANGIRPTPGGVGSYDTTETYAGDAPLNAKWNASVSIQTHTLPRRAQAIVTLFSQDRVFATPTPLATPRNDGEAPSSFGNVDPQAPIPSAPRYEETINPPLSFAINPRNGEFRVSRNDPKRGKVTLSGALPATWREGTFTLSFGKQTVRGTLSYLGPNSFGPNATATPWATPEGTPTEIPTATPAP